MIDITTMEDIKKLKNNNDIKYINLDIVNPDLEVIYYLLEHGQKYSYAERLEDNKGYIYVSYELFKQAELFILEVINRISMTLNELEVARYLYITIGKNIGYDINILPDKNETFDLKNISIINNIWGSIYYGKGTNASFSKLYLYLCSFVGINNKITQTSNLGYLKNTITIQNRNIVTDITQDIPFIQANFKTQFFIGANDNLKLDKKIGYIKEDYSENKIEESLRNIDYSDKLIIETILHKTENLLPIKNMKPIELGNIYEIIFTKYCPNYEIKIHNLYINNLEKKEHFILIEYENTYYSFNYIKNQFVKVDEKEIIEKLENKEIGIYLNEKIPFLTPKEGKALS